MDKLGPDDPNLAIRYKHIGRAYARKGDHDREIESYHKALDIFLSGGRPYHLEVAKSYNNLGRAYSAKGDHDRAIESYQKSLDTFLAERRPDYQYAETVQNNINKLRKKR